MAKQFLDVEEADNGVFRFVRVNTRPWRPEVAAKNEARSIASLVKHGMISAVEVDALIEAPGTTIEHAERI